MSGSTGLTSAAPQARASLTWMRPRRAISRHRKMLPATVHAEEDAIWSPLGTLSLVGITQDTWFWARLQPT